MGRPGSDRLLPFPRLDEAPRFSPDDARALARAHWALDVTASALPSERDQNFVLQATSGDRLVLKIANASEDRAMLDAQQRAMAHLSRTLSIVPRVVPAASGASIIEVPGPHDRRHSVWAITWLPGVPLGTVSPRPAALLEDLGRAAGAVSRGLADFDHDAIHREFYWDLTH
ncbi:MAG TPA: phosphotransferase, partial [Gemmatimonadaceae bacterium]